MSGVKDHSKMKVFEDLAAQAKEVLEMRCVTNMDKAEKPISHVCFEVNKLASKVLALGVVISKGGKVFEKELLRLIELLMNELLKLDGVDADGDAEFQRRMQVRRVQKYVERLDVIKLKNAMPKVYEGEAPVTALSLQHHLQQVLQLQRPHLFAAAAGFMPNDVTMVSAFSACEREGDFELGRWIHSYFKQNEIAVPLYQGYSANYSEEFSSAMHSNNLIDVSRKSNTNNIFSAILSIGLLGAVH